MCCLNATPPFQLLFKVWFYFPAQCHYYVKSVTHIWNSPVQFQCVQKWSPCRNSRANWLQLMWQHWVKFILIILALSAVHSQDGRKINFVKLTVDAWRLLQCLISRLYSEWVDRKTKAVWLYLFRKKAQKGKSGHRYCSLKSLTMTLQLCDCALWGSRCEVALMQDLCEWVGNRAAFPDLREKTLQRKMAGSLQGLLIQATMASA